LVDALNLRIGLLDALVRQGVAGLLNAAHAAVDYPLTTGQVTQLVNGAVASKSAVKIGALTVTLGVFNNLRASGFC
jgi:hypothetical protein